MYYSQNSSVSGVSTEIYTNQKMHVGGICWFGSCVTDRKIENWNEIIKFNQITSFYLVCEAIGTAATPGLLLKMTVEKQMECRLAGETEVLGENLPQRHFCPSQNPTWLDPGLNPGCRDGKPATNHLSFGAANQITYSHWGTMMRGVPDESILGPLLFLIYINYLLTLNNSLMPIIFADDTTVIICSKN
jgi:hypothetical protein